VLFLPPCSRSWFNDVPRVRDALDQPPQGGRSRRRPATLGTLLPPTGRPRTRPAPRRAPARGGRGGCSPVCLRQLLSLCRAGPLPPTARPRRPVATAGDAGGPQGRRTGTAREPAEARRPGPGRGGIGGDKGRGRGAGPGGRR